MKSIGSKTDGTSSLPAASFNSMADEMENFVLDAGLTLDAGSETTADPNPTQLSQALYMASRDGDAFTDSGAADAYVLTKIRGKAETAYRNGARFRFVPANTNTGASTVNIQSIGSKNIRFADNSALTAGAIQANTVCQIYYDLAADNFKLLTPPTASGASPGLYQAGNAPGQTTGTSAPQFKIGEKVIGSYSATSLASSGTIYNPSSISLTPGVWFVKHKAPVTAPGTSKTSVEASISATISTINGANGVKDSSSTLTSCQLLSSDVLYVTATTTYYATVTATYTGTAPTATGGEFFAVRIA